MDLIQSENKGLLVNFKTGFLLTLFVLLYLLLFSASLQSNTFTFCALIVVNLLLTVVCIATYKRVHFPSEGIEFHRILPILIQGTVQLSIFIYVILMCYSFEKRALVQSRMPLIFYQVIFAFIFDYLFIICRGKTYRPRFFVIPMVLSINLFFWFLDAFFILHLVTIIVGILIKTYVVRKEPDGRSTNIFNPSFIVLTLIAFVVFALDAHNHIYDARIAVIYDVTPHFDLFVLCVGCITLWLPDSYVEAMGAYSIIMFLDYISEKFFGYRLFFHLAGSSVMIAIMLGITDPTTSPHSKLGKFFFGVVYGLSLTFINFFMWLSNMGLRDYYSKILAIPLLNIFTRKFDDGFGFIWHIKLNYYCSRILGIFLFGAVVFFTYPRLEGHETYPTYVRVLADQIRVAVGLPPATIPH